MDVFQVQEWWGGNRRTLFVGSSSECFRVAEDLYGVCCGWAGHEWKSVATRVVPFDGDDFLFPVVQGIFLEELAWFSDDDGGHIWGEVERIVFAGDVLDGVIVDRRTVVFGECFRIGADSPSQESFSAGSWSTDFDKCSGVMS